MELEELSVVARATVVALARLEAGRQERGCEESWAIDVDDGLWCERETARLQRMATWALRRWGPVRGAALGVLAWSAVVNGDVDGDGRTG